MSATLLELVAAYCQERECSLDEMVRRARNDRGLPVTIPLTDGQLYRYLFMNLQRSTEMQWVEPSVDVTVRTLPVMRGWQEGQHEGEDDG